MRTFFQYFKLRIPICITTVFYYFIIANLTISCTTKRSSDPIDRLVRELRGSNTFTEGIHTPIPLPGTAKPEEVAAKVLTLALNEPITNMTVLKVKPVIISYEYKPGDIPPLGSEYIAVLVDLKPQQKIVLVQYKKDESAWWNEVYDVK